MWNPQPVAVLALTLLPQAPTPSPAPRASAPLTSATVLKVVDGDTLDVELDGKSETLRLLWVDTEEKIMGKAGGSPSKPETVFGQETALWARELFAAFPAPVQVGLAFPEGRVRDIYGRLLCQLFLPDGRDYELMLVAEGKSPYFNKYGNSQVEHEALVHAQEDARQKKLGIWDPNTNQAKTPGTPSAKRPYDTLLPWWNARAAAIDAFRARAASEPERWLSAEDPAALARAFERCQRDPALRVTVFAAIERFFDESDGSLTALLRPGDEHAALRASIPAAERAALEPLLRSSTEEFHQNYLYVTSRIERNARGFVVSGARRSDWIMAEPAYPPPTGK